MLRGDDRPHLGEILERGATVEFRCRVDGPGLLRLLGIGFSFRVDRLIAVFRSPLAHGVEILEAEAERVDRAMAAGTLRLVLMHLQAFAGRERLARQPRAARHVGRRRGRRVVEHLTEHPGAAFHRARGVAIAAHRQDSRHPEQAAPRRVLRQRHLLEAGPVGMRQAVVVGQHIIDDHVVGLEQVGEAAVPADEMGERLVDLVPGRLLHGVVEPWVAIAVELEEIEPIEDQPLVDERPDEAGRSRVVEQPVGLSRQHRGFQEFTRSGQFAERLVGRATPEEIGEPHREFVGGERPACCVVGGLGEIEEPRRGEHERQGLFQCRRMLVAGLSTEVVYAEQLVDKGRRHRLAAEGLGGKPLDARPQVARGRLRRLVIERHAEGSDAGRSLPVGSGRPLDLQPVDPEHELRADLVAGLADAEFLARLQPVVAGALLPHEERPLGSGIIVVCRSAEGEGKLDHLRGVHGAGHLAGVEPLADPRINSEFDKSAVGRTVGQRRHTHSHDELSRRPVPGRHELDLLTERVGREIRARVEGGHREVPFPIGREIVGRSCDSTVRLVSVVLDGLEAEVLGRRGADDLGPAPPKLSVVLRLLLKGRDDLRVFWPRRRLVHLRDPLLGSPLGVDRLGLLLLHSRREFLPLGPQLLRAAHSGLPGKGLLERLAAQGAVLIELVGRHEEV